jgi:basic membrane protein A
MEQKFSLNLPKNRLSRAAWLAIGFALGVAGFGAALALQPANAEASELRVALVLDKGGKDDKSFNSSAYRGAMDAKDKLHVYVKYVEASDDNSYETMLRAFSQKNFDLIIGVGVAQAEAMQKVAKDFPQKHYAIIDAEVKAPNVRSLLFQEQEGSYLVGALAALKSKTGKIGFIGGMDIPLIRRFQKGYEAGAKKVNPKVKVLINYVGVTGDAWNNPPKAKELAISQYGSGADVIFAAAGASGAGLFDAAEETHKLAIGVDSNQNWIKPGLVLTSMLKRVDTAIYDTIAKAQQGKFEGGIARFGLANEGVDYALDENNAKLIPAAMKKKVDHLKAEIIAGKIQVPDYYKMKK